MNIPTSHQLEQPQPIAEPLNDLTTEPPTIPAWRKPTITRIDIKRTMGGGGSNNDGGPLTSLP